MVVILLAGSCDRSNPVSSDKTHASYPAAPFFAYHDSTNHFIRAVVDSLHAKKRRSAVQHFIDAHGYPVWDGLHQFTTAWPDSQNGVVNQERWRRRPVGLVPVKQPEKENITGIMVVSISPRGDYLFLWIPRGAKPHTSGLPDTKELEVNMKIFEQQLFGHIRGSKNTHIHISRGRPDPKHQQPSVEGMVTHTYCGTTKTVDEQGNTIGEVTHWCESYKTWEYTASGGGTSFGGNSGGLQHYISFSGRDGHIHLGSGSSGESYHIALKDDISDSIDPDCSKSFSEQDSNVQFKDYEVWCNSKLLTGNRLQIIITALNNIEKRGTVCANIVNFAKNLLKKHRFKYIPSKIAQKQNIGGFGGTFSNGGGPFLLISVGWIIDPSIDIYIGHTHDGAPYRHKINLEWTIIHETEHAMGYHDHVNGDPWLTPNVQKCSGLQ